MLFDDDDNIVCKVVALVRRNAAFPNYSSKDIDVNTQFSTSPPTSLEFDSANDDDYDDDDHADQTLDLDVAEGNTRKIAPSSKVLPCVSFNYVTQDDYKIPSGGPSLLSLLLNKKSPAIVMQTGPTVPIIFYMPSSSASLTVYVGEKSLVDAVIQMVLSTHKMKGLLPPLYYDNPERYELRLHDSDGAPDMDFKALDRNKQLLQLGKLAECCLREIPSPSRDVRGWADSEKVDVTAAAAAAAAAASTASSSDRLTRGGTGTGTGDGKAGGTGHPTQPVAEVVTIKLPNAYVKLRLDATSTCLDLLPQVATKHRLRIYIDEYEFIMTLKDQNRLKLMTPVLDNRVPLLGLGLQELVLQRKVYADAAKAGWTRGKSGRREVDAKATAAKEFAGLNMYQEWHVFERDSLGRKHSCRLGLDNQKMYIYREQTGQNWDGELEASHLGSSSRNRNDSQQRYLSSIHKICCVEGSATVLKIFWSDLKEISEVEYICNSAAECNDIVAKVRVLLPKKQGA